VTLTSGLEVTQGHCHLSLARGGVIISPQLFVSCTGYQSTSEFISGLPAGFSRHWLAKHPPTSPTTAAWYQTRTVADSALLTLERVSPPERLLDSVTEVFQLLVLKFGTVYRLHSGLRTWRLTVSNEDLRPICWHWCDDISAPSDYWFLALYKYSLCMYVCVCVCMYVCKVIETGAIQQLECRFPFAFYSNYGHICSRLWYIQRQRVVWP